MGTNNKQTNKHGDLHDESTFLHLRTHCDCFRHVASQERRGLQAVCRAVRQGRRVRGHDGIVGGRTHGAHPEEVPRERERLSVAWRTSCLSLPTAQALGSGFGVLRSWDLAVVQSCPPLATNFFSAHLLPLYRRVSNKMPYYKK